MLEPHSFVRSKSFQLSNYAQAWIEERIPESELSLYCWDTLEEWSQVKPIDFEMTPQESVFWDLLHLIVYWNLSEVKACPNLFLRLEACIKYLSGKGQYPAFCSGVRP